MLEFYKNKFKSYKSITFWCDMAIYFCVFSVLGHLMEHPYCTFNSFFFGIVSDDYAAWNYILEPFYIYGFVVVFLVIFIYPIYEYFLKKGTNKLLLIGGAYVSCVFISLVFELTSGLIFNQPINGVYPLWTNANLPGNILDQAWIINDILLGFVAVLVLAVIHPLCQLGLRKIPKTPKIIVTVIIIALFLFNMYITYWVFLTPIKVPFLANL